MKFVPFKSSYVLDSVRRQRHSPLRGGDARDGVEGLQELYEDQQRANPGNVDFNLLATSQGETTRYSVTWAMVSLRTSFENHVNLGHRAYAEVNGQIASLTQVLCNQIIETGVGRRWSCVKMFMPVVRRL